MTDRETRRAQREAERKAEEEEAERLRLAAAEERRKRREELGITVVAETPKPVSSAEIDDILLEAEAIAVRLFISFPWPVTKESRCETILCSFYRNLKWKQRPKEKWKK